MSPHNSRGYLTGITVESVTLGTHLCYNGENGFRCGRLISLFVTGLLGSEENGNLSKNMYGYWSSNVGQQH